MLKFFIYSSFLVCFKSQASSLPDYLSEWLDQVDVFQAGRNLIPKLSDLYISTCHFDSFAPVIPSEERNLHFSLRTGSGRNLNVQCCRRFLVALEMTDLYEYFHLNKKQTAQFRFHVILYKRYKNSKKLKSL